MTSHKLPRRSERYARVIVTERLSRIGRYFRRKPPPIQISFYWIKSSDLGGRTPVRSIDQNLIPINSHVSDDAHFTICAQKLAREIHRHGLWPSDRYTDVIYNRAPVTFRILYLQRR